MIRKRVLSAPLAQLGAYNTMEANGCREARGARLADQPHIRGSVSRRYLVTLDCSESSRRSRICGPVIGLMFFDIHTFPQRMSTLPRGVWL